MDFSFCFEFNIQNIAICENQCLQTVYLTRLGNCFSVFKGTREPLSSPLTVSSVAIWKNTKNLGADRALATEERCPCRFPLSGSDDCPRLPLSASQIFFCELSAVLFTDC